MTDIVERLRRDSVWTEGLSEQQKQSMCEEAANEIERLRANIERLTANPADYRYWEGRYRDGAADNERLRSALLKITKSVHGSFDDAHVMADIARVALKEGEDE